MVIHFWLRRRFMAGLESAKRRAGALCMTALAAPVIVSATVVIGIVKRVEALLASTDVPNPVSITVSHAHRNGIGVPITKREGVMSQKVGDVCELCRPRWEKAGQEPKVLQAAGTTMNKSQMVPACEYCDGDTLKVSKLDNRIG